MALSRSHVCPTPAANCTFKIYYCDSKHGFNEKLQINKSTIKPIISDKNDKNVTRRRREKGYKDRDRQKRTAIKMADSIVNMNIKGELRRN